MQTGMHLYLGLTQKLVHDDMDIRRWELAQPQSVSQTLRRSLEDFVHQGTGPSSMSGGVESQFHNLCMGVRFSLKILIELEFAIRGCTGNQLRSASSFGPWPRDAV